MKKLRLSKETLRNLDARGLRIVHGGTLVAPTVRCMTEETCRAGTGGGDDLLIATDGCR